MMNRRRLNWTRLTMLMAVILNFNFAISAQPFGPAAETSPNYFWWLVVLTLLVILSLAAAALAYARGQRVVVEETERHRPRTIPEPEPFTETPPRPAPVPPRVEPVPPLAPAVPPVPSITIAPKQAKVEAGQTQSFTATVEGILGEYRLNWQLLPEIGKISRNGVYTAPDDVLFERDVTVRVEISGQADVKDEGVITLTPTSRSAPPAVSIMISPERTELKPGESQKFTASVTGTDNTKVIWSHTPKVLGTISDAGLYTAPEKERVIPGTFVRIIATSDADPAKSATAIVEFKLEPDLSVPTLAPPSPLTETKPSVSSEPLAPVKVCFADFTLDQQEKIVLEVLKYQGNDHPAQDLVTSAVDKMIVMEITGIDTRDDLVKTWGISSEAVRLFDLFVMECRDPFPRKKGGDTDTTRRFRNDLPAIALLVLLSSGRVFAATCYETQTRVLFTAAGATRHFVCQNVPAGTNKIEFVTDNGKAISGIRTSKIQSSGNFAEFDLTVDADVSPIWPKMLANGRDEGHPIRVLSPGQAGAAQAGYDAARQYISDQLPAMVKSAMPPAPPPAPAPPALVRSRPSRQPAQTSAPRPAAPKFRPRFSPLPTAARPSAYELETRRMLEDWIRAEAGRYCSAPGGCGGRTPDQIVALARQRGNTSQAYGLVEEMRQNRLISAAEERIGGRIDKAIGELNAVKTELQSYRQTSVPEERLRSIAREAAQEAVTPVRGMAEQATDAANNASSLFGKNFVLAARADSNSKTALQAFQAQHDRKQAKRTDNPLVSKKERNGAVSAAITEWRAIQIASSANSTLPSQPPADQYGQRPQPVYK
jgi:hypothetical protein